MSDTPEEAQRVNDEIMEALLQDGIGGVKHGGTPKFREVVHQGDDDFPAPVVAKVFEEAGVVPIYDIKTGERSFTSRNLLTTQIKKVGADGKHIFTQRKPEQPVKLGEHRCLLHPEARKPEYDAWGLPECRKANLTSPLQVELHMQHRHKIEWQTIKAAQEKAEREEERELQRQIARAAVGRQNQKAG